jgi:hypothetical protein
MSVWVSFAWGSLSHFEFSWCPWPSLGVVVLEMSLDALLEMCDGASCSLKMFLFICPCILFGLCRYNSRVSRHNCRCFVIWSCGWGVKGLPMNSLVLSGLTLHWYCVGFWCLSIVFFSWFDQCQGCCWFLCICRELLHPITFVSGVVSLCVGCFWSIVACCPCAEYACPLNCWVAGFVPILAFKAIGLILDLVQCVANGRLAYTVSSISNRVQFVSLI